MPDNEKQFEQDIESFLISPAGGWQKASDAGYRTSMDSGMALDLGTLVGFIKATQPIQWQRFENSATPTRRRNSTRPLRMRWRMTA